MVKLLMMSLMKTLGVENLWDNILGKKVSQAFGQECASAAIWMCFILLVRSALSVVGWTSYVPNGLLFSFPYLIQVLSSRIPFMRDSPPLVPVRIAECLLRRIPPSSFVVVFPAHFLGCIVGIVFFQCLCPNSLHEVMDPVTYPQAGFSVYTLLSETVLVACFCLLFLVARDVLILNRFKEAWLSAFVLPLYFILPAEQCPTFNPAALYALWYVHVVSTDNADEHSQMQVERILGPILGAVLAGMVCLRFFPHDPACWKPKH